MMKDQHARVCLGHRAENRIMIRDRRLLQGKAALLPPFVIVLSSVLLVRPVLAQDFGQLSRCKNLRSLGIIPSAIVRPILQSMHFERDRVRRRRARTLCPYYLSSPLPFPFPSR